MFKLTIETDNAAFGNGKPFNAAPEVARIMAAVIEGMRHGREHGKCFDVNGNSVGDWGFSDE